MKFYLDTAKIEEIKVAMATGVLSGVTTNPSLIMKAGGDFHEMIRDICALNIGDVSAEVLSDRAEDMIAEGKGLASLSPHVVVKVPMTSEGLMAVHTLGKAGIRTNVTLIFSTAQALLAAEAGATFVSPFVGRLDDSGVDGAGVVSDIADAFRIGNVPTRIIAASIRNVGHMEDVVLAGAHIATIPYAVFMEAITHSLTTAGLQKFKEDWQRR